jgi:hypothetical protein
MSRARSERAGPQHGSPLPRYRTPSRRLSATPRAREDARAPRTLQPPGRQPHRRRAQPAPAVPRGARPAYALRSSTPSPPSWTHRSGFPVPTAEPLTRRTNDDHRQKCDPPKISEHGLRRQSCGPPVLRSTVLSVINAPPPAPSPRSHSTNGQRPSGRFLRRRSAGPMGGRGTSGMPRKRSPTPRRRRDCLRDISLVGVVGLEASMRQGQSRRRRPTLHG